MRAMVGSIITTVCGRLIDIKASTKMLFPKLVGALSIRFFLIKDAGGPASVLHEDKIFSQNYSV